MAAALEMPNVPQTIGRYVLYGVIASGGMATVHFGRLVGPAGFARPVAIKRLHAQYARDPDFVRMFLDEARLAARVVHPNVVQTLDLVETTDEVFLVMDYVRGLALSSLVRALRAQDTRIPLPVALGIVIGVLEGLHAAHEAKDDMGERLDLVHRDVSPQNILVGTDGTARLLDFGVAKAAGRSQSTRDGQVKGKIAYMAPEQVRGEPLTRRTDIFAASVLLWEVLTGRRLFFGDSDADSFRRVLHEEVQPPSAFASEVPPALDRVVLRGLERDAAARHATAHDMAIELGACLPPASAAQIGEWVERSAAEELHQRASRIAAIERSAAESMSRLTAFPAVPGAGAPDAPTPIGMRPVEARPAARPAVEEETSGLARSPEPRGSRGLRLWLAMVVAVVAVATTASVVAFGRHRAGASSAIRAPVPVVALSSAGSGTALPPANSSSAPAASEGVVPAELPSARSAPPPGKWVAAAPTGGPPRAAPEGVPVPLRTAPSAHGAGKPGCDPPYTEDAQGHIHFKPSCM